MSGAVATAPALSRRTMVREASRLVPLYGATLMLWSYIVSYLLYKTWYIAAAIALVATAIVASAGALRTRGLIRAVIPILAYFAVLLAGMFWAPRPKVTLLWVAIDSIEIVVFILFFLAARNARPRKVMGAVCTILIPAILVSAAMVIKDPRVSRLAWYALPMLPVIVGYGWGYVYAGQKRWPGIVVLVTSFTMLVLARSRTPLAVAVIISGLSLLAYSRNFWQVLKVMIVIALVGVILLGVLFAIPTTRFMLLWMYVRLSDQPVIWGDIYIPAEGVDMERVYLNKLGVQLLYATFPLGLGYMNYMGEFEKIFGIQGNLHNSYLTWATEGGLACILVVLWIFGEQFIGLLYYTKYAPTREEKIFGRACMITTFGMLLMGLFHQMHQTPALWLLLGAGAACRAQLREDLTCASRT